MTPPPIPDRIASATIGHSVDLARLEVGQRMRVRAELLKLGKTLAREIMDSGLDTPRTDWQRARIRSLADLASKAIDATFGRISEDHADQLRGLVQVSTDGLTAAINEAIGADLMVPVQWTPEQLARIVDDTLIQGAPSAEWWSRQAMDLKQAFGDQMRAGQLRGETLAQLRDRIIGSDLPGVGAVGKVDLRRVPDVTQRALIHRARRNAEALVRTSVIATANQAHLDLFAANSDIMGGIVWLSTLDTRTTPICMALDGCEWSLPDLEPVGHSHAFPGATAHWCCRSTQLSKTKSWAELARAAGGDERLAAELDKIPAGDRASLGGPVSGKLTYEGWLRDQSDTVQLEALGPARLKLWKQGKLTSFSDLVSQDGNPLTVEQLKARRSSSTRP